MQVIKLLVMVGHHVSRVLYICGLDRSHRYSVWF